MFDFASASTKTKLGEKNLSRRVSDARLYVADTS